MFPFDYLKISNSSIREYHNLNISYGTIIFIFFILSCAYKSELDTNVLNRHDCDILHYNIIKLYDRYSNYNSNARIMNKPKVLLNFYYYV